MLFDSLPERKRELNDIWERYAPKFSLSDDTQGFSINAGPYGLILFTNRTMKAIWILGFTAWEAFSFYSVSIFYLQATGKNLSAKILSELPDQSKEDMVFANYINRIRQLMDTEQLNDYQWPNSIPRPYDGKPKNDEGSVIFDINCMAATYIFLHEVQHMKFCVDGKNNIDPIDEEIQCDEFARSMLLDKLYDYSKDSGNPLGLLKSKRAMSIAFASFLLLVITPKTRWGGTRSHPSISNRIRGLTQNIHLPENDLFWIYLSCVFLADLRYEKCMLGEIAFSSQKDLCLKLIDSLEQY